MIRSVLLATVALVGTAAAAHAQEAARDGGALDEVIVTATRRESSLQQTAVSVSALSAESLRKMDITRVDQVAASVPNFYVAPGVANSSTVSVSMRGRGDNAGGFGITEQPVGFYFDDVYQARPAAVNSEFSDIERVEVLRGPQGTLFGRNSMTGAVNIISATPGDDVTGNASLSYGNYETFKAKGAVGGPIVKGVLAGSLAAVYSEQGKGYMRQPTIGGTTDARNFSGLRGKLHYYGSETWDVVLQASHTENDNDGYVASPVNTATIVPFTGSYYDTLTPQDSFGKTKVTAASAQIRGKFDGFTIKSITARSTLDDEWLVDLTGGLQRPTGQFVTGFARNSNIDQDQISQELQIFGEAWDGRLDWIGGVYFFDEEVTQSLKDVIYFRASNSFVPSPEIYYKAKTRSIAGYAQATYKISAGFEAVLGGRYTKEDKSISGRVNPTSPYSGQTEFSAFTPKFGLNYQISPTVFAYGSISQGFRSGGYPAGGTTVLVASQPFGPEKVWAYEAGLKTDLFERRARLNIAAFVNNFDDLVVNYFIPNTAVIVQANALSERVYGVEVEFTARPVQGLEVYLNGGVQRESEIQFEAGAQVPANLVRNAVVPFYSGAAGFKYEAPISALGGTTLRLGADYVFRDWFYSNINNLPVTKTSTINELNAQIALASERGWTVSLAGRNLTNREQWKNGVGLAFINAAGRQPVEPRTYRLEVAYRY